MGMFKGFRDFILRGNVIDLAVAVVIGASFTGVVNGVTEGFIKPLIAAIGGQPDTAGLNIGIFKVGDILGAIINFLITAGVVYFFVVAPMNRLMARFKPAEAEPSTMRTCPECLSDIPLGARRCRYCTASVTAA